MNVSLAGIAFIKQQEGLRQVAYRDSAGILTIGYGHTGSDVTQGIMVTESQAEQLLLKDLETAEKCVNNCVKLSITQNQFDALISLAFNIGCGNFGQSHVLARLNDGDDANAANDFLNWSHCNGVEVPGLLARREAEKAMFLA